MINPFAEFERESLKLLKQDGTVVEGLRTTGISKGKVIFFREDVDFQEGDMLERRLPSGRVETFQIDDVEYVAALDVVPGHYTLRITNVAKPKSTPMPYSVTYNLHGSNTRVNIHSTDYSHNVVGIDPADLFKKVEEALVGVVSDAAELGELKQQLADMRAAQGQPTFTTTYVKFMEIAADHMTVLAPFLPALAQLLVLSSGVTG
ncbi:hypothetical protein DAETH_09900 [Deinococcus aetherius]|uniref:Uncharacterized protein n=1 Tax=Deinococcus aetherius TaxID=200252 RepID=A0ABM8ABE7_9DEIO|nr:hypothetical protein [Deinococcus aetherius]BDP41021.1 hypothetical protein DAETH_09900 [Deinococcus aetherius]